MSPRQKRIVGLVAAGCTNGEIARHLGVTRGAVSGHLRCVRRGLRPMTREQLGEWYVQRQFVAREAA